MSKILDKVKSSYCRAYISQHYEGWEARAFEKYDINNYLQTLDSVGTDVVIVTARTHNGYWYTDIGMGRMHPGLKGLDQVAHAVDYFHKRDKLVMAYFSIVYDKEAYDMHPEWRQVDANGVPLYVDSTYGKIACMNSPYRELAIDMVQRLVKTKNIDGILLDMMFMEEKICHCESCKKAFRSQYNREMPLVEDPDDEAYKDYVEFRRNTTYNFAEEVIESIKKVNPDVMCYFQFLPNKVEERTTQRYDMAAIGDYTYSDVYFESGGIQMSMCTNFESKLTKLRPEMGLMTRPGTHDDTPNMKPIDQLRSEAFAIISNGGALHLFDIMWPDGTIQKAMWERNAQIAKEVKERAPWLGGVSNAQVALLHSEDTMITFGKEDTVSRVLAHVFGMGRAFLESGIPFDIITKPNAETLKQYDVLLLPNVACISDEETEAIRQFVHAGGGLIATNKTSLFDEKGKRRKNFALADVFGVDCTLSDTAAYSRIYTKYDVESAIGKGLPEDGMMTSRGISTKVRAKSAEVVSKLVYPYCEPTAEMFINVMSNAPAVYSEWPGCTINTYGAGRVVYFSGQPEADYIKMSFPEHKLLLCNALEHVLSKAKRVELVQDLPTELTIYTKPKEIVVHVLNKMFGLGRDCVMHAGGSVFDKERARLISRALIHKTYPLHNLDMKIHVEEDVESVWLQPSNIQLPFQKDGDTLAVCIPEVAYHEMVVVKLV